MFKVNRILVPVDYSDTSRAALSEAIQLAHRHGATLYTLHVVDTLGRDISRDLDDTAHVREVGNQIDAQETALRDAVALEYSRMEEAGMMLDASKVATKHRVSGGEPVAVCLGMVDELEIDAIVLGTHGGHKGLKRFFVGSVAERLVKQAPCSVFVVKPKGYPYLTD